MRLVVLRSRSLRPDDAPWGRRRGSDPARAKEYAPEGGPAEPDRVMTDSDVDIFNRAYHSPEARSAFLDHLALLEDALVQDRPLR